MDKAIAILKNGIDVLQLNHGIGLGGPVRYKNKFELNNVVLQQVE